MYSQGQRLARIEDDVGDLTLDDVARVFTDGGGTPSSPPVITASGVFGAPELAGMLRGLFASKLRECAIEREDRMHTALALRQGQDEWHCIE